MSKADFVDYYDLMQISPKAELEAIKRIYKLLVSRLHPDNAETGDAEKFLLIRRALRLCPTRSEEPHTTPSVPRASRGPCLLPSNQERLQKAWMRSLAGE
jgi:hypothetical protein